MKKIDQKRRLRLISGVVRTGDCILMAPVKKNFFSDGIKAFTDSIFSHAAGICDPGYIVEFTIWFKWGFIPRTTCRRVKLGTYVKKKYRLTVRRPIGIDQEIGFRIRREMLTDVSLKKKYNIKSYIGFMIFSLLRKAGIRSRKVDNMFASDSKSVCSSGYDEWTRRAGIDLFPNLGQEQVVPQDIAVCKLMETVYDENEMESE